ncbi:MAG: hypothetical protein ABIH47_06320 [Candidatus Omnitrophota bacterium]
MKQMKILLVSSLIILLPVFVWAYIDPGTGGYVISPFPFIMLGVFFLIAAAFILYLFRNTIGRRLFFSLEKTPSYFYYE